MESMNFKISCGGDYNIFFNELDVIKVFKGCKKKTSGPDNIGEHLIKVCAEQLAPVFCYIFQWSLALQRVPKLWKQATVVPVPKTANSTNISNNEMFEKLVKEELSKTKNLLDPLQFAYRRQRGVEDATATLLNLVLKHLEGNKTYIKPLFVDFSSAFNLLQPYILADKLITNFGLDFNLVGWILDFLRDRTQRVRVNGSLSASLMTSIGTLQGCVCHSVVCGE
ncbi:RNA-directed DNA polymerase from mobile element jockey [Labeo rohita]|uniref:RNA-directed DNA polymerase from mobile element jockey n=1 Tax=Labeo rohita TaxID=84645 RepID=A0ABQ8LHT9_LABRO|nr:RNA-directed DNA polymerase from mobile element jockey [Labeo rohita]